MPEPVSLTVTFVGYAALHAVTRYGRTGFSSEAISVERAAARAVCVAEQSFSLFGDRALAISELLEMVAAHGPDWNGEGARGVSRTAAQNAEAFIRCLPDDLPMPEFAPEPTGSISLDWYSSRSRFISLSLGEGDRIPYAWIDGTDRGYAVAAFDKRQIPLRLLAAIRATLTSHVAVRVA